MFVYSAEQILPLAADLHSFNVEPLGAIVWIVSSTSRRTRADELAVEILSVERVRKRT